MSIAGPAVKVGKKGSRNRAAEKRKRRIRDKG
jgi:hypothetical protein